MCGGDKLTSVLPGSVSLVVDKLRFKAFHKLGQSRNNPDYRQLFL